MIIILSTLGILFVSLLCVSFIFMTGSDRSVLLQREKSFAHNGIDRFYHIRESSGTSDQTAIVVGLHGFSGDAKMFAYYTGIQNTLPESDIILYPKTVDPQLGQKTGWNAGFCCGSGWAQNAQDAEFILALIESTKQEYDVPDAKVFVTGFSNGAFMTQRLAAEYPDVIDATASASGTIGTESFQLEPTSPVPILLMHGEKDTRVSFSGGSSNDDPEFDWKSHTDTVAAWTATNQESAETKAITYPEDKHQWHDWRLFNIWHKKPAASVEVARFFNNYR